MKKLFAFILALCLAVLAGCELPAIDLSGGGSSPEDDFSAFLGCLSAGDYDGCSDYIYNYASLGMNRFDEPVYDLMLDSLNNSRSFTVNDCRVSGRDAVLDIEYTTLDFRKLSRELSSSTVELVEDRQFESGDTLSDEEIESLMMQNLSEMMQSPSSYCTTQNYSLDMRYADGRWKLVCSDAFYSALIGYIV